jgi:hypothetical protein
MESDELFDRRLRAAVRAGAWLLLVPFGLLVLQWFAYLAVMAARPAWFLSLWGPGVDWALVQTLWLGAVVALKLFFWFHLIAVLWGALWASMLRKTRPRASGHLKEGSGPLRRLSVRAPSIGAVLRARTRRFGT